MPAAGSAPADEGRTRRAGGDEPKEAGSLRCSPRAEAEAGRAPSVTRRPATLNDAADCVAGAACLDHCSSLEAEAEAVAEVEAEAVTRSSTLAADGSSCSCTEAKLQLAPVQLVPVQLAPVQHASECA